MSKPKTEPIDPVSALGFKPDFDTIILHGDCLNWLNQMPAESVNCLVTSPPYFGLRSYNTYPQIWDGKTGCKHEWGTERYYREGGASGGSQEAFAKAGPENAARLKATRWRENTICDRCGAWRGELGAEPDITSYVTHLVQIFKVAWRVLRDDGTLWLNLGDSYAAQGGPQVDGTKQAIGSQTGAWKGKSRRPPLGCKEKDLMGIPWRVALALQADGWYLRADIIWAKGNGMTESVTDRTTRSHEYIFLLSKKPRYYYDYKAIREKASVRSGKAGSFRRENSKRAEAIPGQSVGTHRPDRTDGIKEPDWKNKRSVWNINVKPFRGAHFATFPQALVEPCILAGCPEGGVVLDPFAGSGTVGITARSLNRRSVLIELNPEYVEMIENRLEDRFTTVSSRALPANT
jgi:DNA modification methylase